MKISGLRDMKIDVRPCEYKHENTDKYVLHTVHMQYVYTQSVSPIAKRTDSYISERCVANITFAIGYIYISKLIQKYVKKYVDSKKNGFISER